MVDFTCYSREEFNLHKTAATSELISRYEAIFKAHECFSFTSMYAMPSSKPKGGGAGAHKHALPYGARHATKRHPPQQAQPRARRPVESEHDKPFSKRVKSILNVLNDGNYDKQLNKLRLVIQNDNVTEVANTILHTAISQVFYVRLFVRLIKDLQFTSFRHMITDAVDSFVKGFVSNREISVSPPVPEGATAYDEFCLLQKRKLLCVSKGVVIAHMFANGLTTASIQDFTEYVCSEATSPERDDTTVDIVLQLLAGIKHLVHCTLPPSSVFDEYSKNTQKIRFMIEDVYKNE